MKKLKRRIAMSVVLIFGAAFAAAKATAIGTRTTVDQPEWQITNNCQSSRSSAPYGACLGDLVAQNNGGTTDIWEEGARTNRGAQFDHSRDRIYKIARAAGNAYRCKIITVEQSAHIISYNMSQLFSGNVKELEKHVVQNAEKGDQIPDCSFWLEHPDAARAEQSLATSATKAMGH